MSEVLQQAMLSVADHKTCRKKMKYAGKVYRKAMLCAGAQGKGGCQVKFNFCLVSNKQLSENKECKFSITGFRARFIPTRTVYFHSKVINSVQTLDINSAS